MTDEEKVIRSIHGRVELNSTRIPLTTDSALYNMQTATKRYNSNKVARPQSAPVWLPHQRKGGFFLRMLNNAYQLGNNSRDSRTA